MEPLRRAFRGYDPAQVDDILADLRTQVSRLEQDNQRLRWENEQFSTDNQRLRSDLETLRETESAVKGALISAHRRADEVLADARRESEILLQVAREAGAKLQDELRGRIDDLNWQIERLSLQRQRFRGEFKDLLEDYMSSLVEPEAARQEPTDLLQPANLAAVHEWIPDVGSEPTDEPEP